MGHGDARSKNIGECSVQEAVTNQPNLGSSDRSRDGLCNSNPDNDLTMATSDAPQVKSFEERLNDIIAPTTRAWKHAQILSAIIAPGAFKDNELEVTVKLKLKKDLT